MVTSRSSEASRSLTHYCRAMNLARVARTYGWHISAEALRYSENTKAQVCRAIGFDIRVNEICAPFQSGGGNLRLTN